MNLLRKKLQKKNKRLRGQGRKMVFLVVAGMAAVLLLAIGMLFLFRSFPEVEVSSIACKQEPKKVTLEYANGKTLVLDVNSLVMNDKGKITDHVVAKENMAVAEGLRLNRLSVPKGGDFSLTLADGTVIRLNADSRLQYPSEFSGDSRIVYLEGEAFFNVAKDKTKPFIVKTSFGDVRVLGTAFGISAYASEPESYTTLVRGKVSVEREGMKPVVILPGEQVVTFKDGKMIKQEVDVEEFVGWKDGIYVFKEKSLGEIMKTLERWYNISVDFQDKSLVDLPFTGNLKRYDDINVFFDALTRTGDMKYRVEGNQVILFK